MFPESNMVISTKSFHMTDDEFVSFCIDNPDLRIERDSNFNIIVMSPVLHDSSELSGEVYGQLREWNNKNKKGKVFDSSGGFTLENNAVRSPDATWIELTNFRAAVEKKGLSKGFLKVAPDFIAEVKSESDSLQVLESKITEYLSNGVRLAYLINPDDKTVSIYQPEKEKNQKSFSEKIIATDVVEGFELDLSAFLKTED